ncbi:hypothetical protein N7451_001346 [Penicillium sp. IBT 35674x]|nr:hypothetical protein N7451_001346 [Penicillium sp. IBT 35674x]
MSSSAAFSAVATSRPGIARPALSQLASSHTTQSRRICCAARNTHSLRNKSEHTWPFDKSHREPLASTRSGFSGICAGRKMSFWESEREQILERMSHLRTQFSERPFGAIFGYQVDFFKRMDELHQSRPGSLWSFIDTEHPMSRSNVHPKAHLQDFNFTQSPEISRDNLRYDPICGRMVPKEAQPAVHCIPGSELEANFVGNPSPADKHHFQPGAAPQDATSKEPVDSQTIDCPPGSELNALFTSIPTSYQNIRTKMGGYQESAHKPNINIDCPPGNELEALFTSEFNHSGQTQAEIFKPSRHMKKLSVDAGLKSGESVECAPGSELEALFASDPTNGMDQAHPLKDHETYSLESTNTLVDCPPGNELDAKFASNSSFRTAGDKAEAIVGCPPGSELDAKLIAEPISTTEDGQFQPSLVADDLHTQQANITQDCQSGNELEAMFISKAAGGSPSLTEDLSSLQASDIRARYASLDAGIKSQSCSSKDIELSGTEDRIGDYIQQATNTSTSEIQEPPAAVYRILTYDSSISQVTTAESDLFFGVNESCPLVDVLSRLQNPGKFVPYFEQMQRDGYEIVTGGGDILVFRKADNVTSQAATKHDPALQVDTAQFLRHDSDPTGASASSSSPSFTNQPPPSPGSSGVEEPVSSHPESISHKIFRRVILTSTATAASCYAIGVVVEYFRTGGQDGYGIDGFTAFESERRHRD